MLRNKIEENLHEINSSNLTKDYKKIKILIHLKFKLKNFYYFKIYIRYQKLKKIYTYRIRKFSTYTTL